MTIRPELLRKDPPTLKGKVDNGSALPDRLLVNTIPIFTIRHPVLQARSTIDAIYSLSESSTDAEIQATSDWAWSRLMHDWYVAHGITPVVLDADDFMTSKNFTKAVCVRVGLNPGEAVFKWPRTPQNVQDEMRPSLRSIQQVLIDSNGLIHGRAARSMDLQAEKEKWERDYSGRKLAILKDLTGSICTRRGSCLEAN